MMKQILIAVILGVALLAVAVVGYVYNHPAETPPDAPVSGNDKIQVEQPQPGDTISSPVRVHGRAKGSWFFEASFPIIVTDWDGRIIGEGIATADGDWMTDEFVPFTGEIRFSLPAETPYKRGALIFKKDNPSGLPQNDDAFEMPVLFK